MVDRDAFLPPTHANTHTHTHTQTKISCVSHHSSMFSNVLVQIESLLGADGAILHQVPNVQTAFSEARGVSLCTTFIPQGNVYLCCCVLPRRQCNFDCFLPTWIPTLQEAQIHLIENKKTTDPEILNETTWSPSITPCYSENMVVKRVRTTQFQV